MNRSERRRQERDDRKRRTIEIPDGRLLRADVLTPQGVEEVTNWRQLPAKQPGVHRWVCVVSHFLSDEQAEAFEERTPGNPVLLDASSVMYAGTGCVDCDQPYGEVVGKKCPAGDEWSQ